MTGPRPWWTRRFNELPTAGFDAILRVSLDRRNFIKGLAGTGVALSGCASSRWISDSEAADDHRLRRLEIDHDACIGCFLCEDACHAINSRPEEEGRSSNSEDRSLIHIHSFMPGPYHVVWSCLGCPDIPCVRACDYYASPFSHQKALHIDERSGAITLEKNACAGCERCIEACQRDGGDVLRWDNRDFITGACHLCGGDPVCVSVCPERAIRVVDVDREAILAHRRPLDVAREGIARREGRCLEPEELDSSNAPLRALRVHHERCTGCRLCEAACGERNRPIDVGGESIAGLGDSNGALIQVHRFAGPTYIAWACLGCPDVPCVTACEAEAFGLDQPYALGVDPNTGTINLAPEHCTECRKCIDACSEEGGGVLSWDAERFVVGACHLCGGEPACIPACPFDAIELVDVDRRSTLAPRAIDDVAQRAYESIYGSTRDEA